MDNDDPFVECNVCRCDNDVLLEVGMFHTLCRLSNPLAEGCLKNLNKLTSSPITNFINQTRRSHRLVSAILCFFVCFIIIRKTWKGMHQTKMEGGT